MKKYISFFYKIIFSFFWLFLVCNCLASCENKPICTEHDLYETIIVNATCSNNGSILVKCKNCDYEEIKEISPLEHKVVIDEEIKPTCELLGQTEGSHCELCGLVIKRSEPIQKINHEIVNATCEKPAHCINCGYEIGDTLPHNFDNGICRNCSEEEIVKSFKFKLSIDLSYYILDGVLDNSPIIHIPSKYKGLPVKVINSYAFKDNSLITSIYIPSSIEIIEKEAFVNLESLESIYFSSGIKEIKHLAFLDLNNLTNIYFDGCINEWLDINFYDKTSNPMCYASFFYIDSNLISDVIINEDISCLGYQLYNMKQLKNVSFLKNISSIKEGALKGLVNLETLVLPYLGSSKEDPLNQTIDYLFSFSKYDDSLKESTYNNFKLREITLTNLSYISKQAFINIKNLKKVTIKGDIKTIEEQAFYKLSITCVVLSDSIEVIEEQAFYNCSSLISINMPSNLIEIKDKAFYCCSNLSLEISKTVKSIGEYSFYYNGYVNLNIPSNVETIGKYAFANNELLENVTFENGVKVIEEGLFNNCWQLKNVKLSNSITQINEYAFSYCESLDSINILKNITTIKKEAFYCSYSLLYLEANKIPNDFEEGFNLTKLAGYDAYINLPYYLNISEKTYYKDDNFEYVIENGYATLTNVINENITDLTIPQTISIDNNAYQVLKIGTFAFHNVKIKINASLTIPENVFEISDCAFYNFNPSYSKISLYLPKFLKRIGKYCFANGVFFQITTGSNYVGKMQILEEGTFYNTTVENKLTLPNTIKTFEEKSFHVSNIKYLTLPTNLENVIDSGLHEQSTQTYTEYLNGLYIGTSTNKYHTLVGLIDINVEEFEVHKDCKIIAKNCFTWESMSLNKIILPEGLLCIDSNAFSGLPSLKEIKIPSTVKYISDTAFNINTKIN